MTTDLWEEGCHLDLLFRNENYTISYSLHLDELSPSVLITAYYKKELLRCGLRHALIYWYNNKSLGVYLILCSFSRAVVVGSPQRTYDLSGHRFLYVFQFVDNSLDVIRKWLVILMTFMPLLHRWACLVRPIIMVAYRVHN